MNYSIKYGKKGTYSIWLDKSGNKYVVGDLDTADNSHTIREEFDRYDAAERRFNALCSSLGITITNVEHDPNNYKF